MRRLECTGECKECREIDRAYDLCRGRAEKDCPPHLTGEAREAWVEARTELYADQDLAKATGGAFQSIRLSDAELRI